MQIDMILVHQIEQTRAIVQVATEQKPMQLCTILTWSVMIFSWHWQKLIWNASFPNVRATDINVYTKTEN